MFGNKKEISHHSAENEHQHQPELDQAHHQTSAQPDMDGRFFVNGGATAAMAAGAGTRNGEHEDSPADPISPPLPQQPVMMNSHPPQMEPPTRPNFQDNFDPDDNEEVRLCSFGAIKVLERCQEKVSGRKKGSKA